MKNTFKLLGIIGLMLVIGFSFAACGGGDDDSGSGGGGGGGSGGISGGTVTYPDGITDADKPTDFSYYFDDRVYPLSNYINDPASVTISGDKLTIKLGIPKDQYLEVWNMSGVMSGVIATPSDAKLFIPDAVFSTVDAKYILMCGKVGVAEAGLCYVDRDVTIKGTHQVSKGDIYNLSLKKGWNYVIHSTDQATDTITYTSSVSMPSDFIWIVFRYR